MIVYLIRKHCVVLGLNSLIHVNQMFFPFPPSSLEQEEHKGCTLSDVSVFEIGFDKVTVIDPLVGKSQILT